MVRRMTERVFRDPRPFHAALEAEQFAASYGLKVGPMEAGKPRALARQNPPRRWSELSEQAQRNLAGFMDGDMRRGPVRVWIDEGKR